MNKNIVILLRGLVILLIGLLLIPLAALAGDRGHDHPTLPYIPVIPVQPPQVITHTYNTDIYTDPQGIALGIANAQTQFDFGTHRWQWSAGAGHYDGETGLAFGLGKRVDRALITGTISREREETGYGVGVHGRF